MMIIHKVDVDSYIYFWDRNPRTDAIVLTAAFERGKRGCGQSTLDKHSTVCDLQPISTEGLPTTRNRSK